MRVWRRLRAKVTLAPPQWWKNTSVRLSSSVFITCNLQVFMLISRASLVLAIPVLTATYLFGAYSGRHELFPFSIYQALKSRAVARAPDLYTVDKAGRLASGDQKKAITCPQ